MLNIFQDLSNVKVRYGKYMGRRKKNLVSWKEISAPYGKRATVTRFPLGIIKTLNPGGQPVNEEFKEQSHYYEGDKDLKPL